jgi:sec-independent protein translocase protein TatA
MGPIEMILLLTVVGIIFGVGRLPEIGSAVGKAIREFRRGQSGAENAD